MNNHWYLISSLPLLRIGEKPPVDAALFRDACAAECSAGELAAIEAALESRQPPAGPAADWWNRETQLRNALLRLRGKQAGVDPTRFFHPHQGFSVWVETLATDAFTRANPLEREMEIDRARWALADEQAIAHPFGFPALLAYAVKLRIALRWAGMDDETGREQVEQLIASAFEQPDTQNG